MEAGREKWRRTKEFNWADRAWAKQRETIYAQTAPDIAHLRAATDLARLSTEDQRNKLHQVEKRDQAIYKLLANNAQITIDLYRTALGKALQGNGNHVNIGGTLHTGRAYMQMPTTIDAEILRTLIS